MKYLTKSFICFFAVLCMAAFLFVGCGSKSVKSVTVSAYIYDDVSESWTLVKSKVVDIHNNLVLDEPENIPGGKQFYGWSTDQNWTEGSDAFVIEGNYITLAKVKDAAKNGAINLYPAFKTAVEYYFVFAVTAPSVSGVDETTLGAIRTALNNYLQTQQGATVEDLALVDVRQYTLTGVADYGAKINQDGDVDVLLGCGANITTQGNVPIVVKTTNANRFTINGETNRCIALLNYDDLSIAVYNWFQTYIEDNFDSNFTPVNFVKTECIITYSLGEHAATTAIAPTQDPVFNNQKITLPAAPEAEEGFEFIGWKVGDAAENTPAGTEITITQSVTITAQYRSTSTYSVTYSNGLPTRTAATETPTAETDLTSGAQVTLPAAPAAKAGFVFAGWKVGDDNNFKEAGETITVTEDVTITAQYSVNAAAVTNTTMQIAYLVYNNSGSTSGFSQDGGAAYINNVIAAIATYLGNVGITYGNNITGIAYVGAASAQKTEVNSAVANNELNVGIALGFGNAHNPNYFDRAEGFNMGVVTTSDRVVNRLKDNAITNIIYDWMVTPGSTFVTAVVTTSSA